MIFINEQILILFTRRLNTVSLYEQLCKNTDVCMILSNINEVLNKVENGMLMGCHGWGHALFVVDTIEYILKSLSFSTKTVELGKITALLHDIGNIAGRQNHARKGAMLATVFLDDLNGLNQSETDMIVQAIDDHTEGVSILSAIGASLLIADKADISISRRLNVEHINDWYGNLLKIKDVNISVDSRVIATNFITTKSFSSDVLLGGYTKGLNLMRKAAEYLGCTYTFDFKVAED